MTARFEVEGRTPLRGTALVPGDKSISHRALLLAALAQDPSRLRNLSPGSDLLATRRLIEAMGAVVTDAGEAVTVEPRLTEGADALAVDCANSGTTMRLGAGVLSMFNRTSLLWGDASLSGRPMARVLEPLAAMGAKVWSVDGHAPVVVEGGELRGIDFTPGRPSAQVKSAILLAGLGADGDTTVREPVPTRAHTEEMLRAAGAPITTSEGRCTVRSGPLNGLELEVPGDPSAAAFWAVAASIVPDSEIVIEAIYRGPGRNCFVDVLVRMGADLDFVERAAELADLRVRHAPLTSTEITDPTEIAACVDELPVLAVAAACATGTTVIKGAQELRVKESDRLAAMTEGLQAFGAEIESAPDGLVIEGRGPSGLDRAVVHSRGDHRIAMALAVAALAASGRSRIQGWDSVDVSDPGFEQQLATLVAA
ncbi:MAG: 3-phosphoshikimate 1-carboxyvinyltransferase [Actinobacteria bacterium]|nr:3-phosphoshikimate 1-carboxyvinyltransferase [Actinomycetota bacterium]